MRLFESRVFIINGLHSNYGLAEACLVYIIYIKILDTSGVGTGGAGGAFAPPIIARQSRAPPI